MAFTAWGAIAASVMKMRRDRDAEAKKKAPEPPRGQVIKEKTAPKADIAEKRADGTVHIYDTTLRTRKDAQRLAAWLNWISHDMPEFPK